MFENLFLVVSYYWFFTVYIDKVWWSCWSIGSSRIICSFSSWWSQSEWKRSCLAWFSEWLHQHFGNLSYIGQILSVNFSYFSFPSCTKSVILTISCHDSLQLMVQDGYLVVMKILLKKASEDIVSLFYSLAKWNFLLYQTEKRIKCLGSNGSFFYPKYLNCSSIY